MQKNLKLAASFIAVLTALAVSGVSVVLADDNNTPNPVVAQPKAKEVKVKPGETVVAEDGDTVVIEADKSKDKSAAVQKKEVKAAPASTNDEFANTSKDKQAVSAAKDQPIVKPMVVMDDDFSSKGAAEDPVDTDSVAELALRGFLSPTGPAIGGTLGFSWRPANRVRIYAGFNAGKGLLELKGDEKELLQLGFTAGASRMVTRTVEVGLFGTASWSYRDLVKDTSASFFGAGPGFRLNKVAGVIFFEAGLPVGLSKKFATGDWEWKSALQASVGFHF